MRGEAFKPVGSGKSSFRPPTNKRPSARATSRQHASERASEERPSKCIPMNAPSELRSTSIHLRNPAKPRRRSPSFDLDRSLRNHSSEWKMNRGSRSVAAASKVFFSPSDPTDANGGRGEPERRRQIAVALNREFESRLLGKMGPRLAFRDGRERGREGGGRCKKRSHTLSAHG